LPLFTASRKLNCACRPTDTHGALKIKQRGVACGVAHAQASTYPVMRHVTPSTSTTPAKGKLVPAEVDRNMLTTTRQNPRHFHSSLLYYVDLFFISQSRLAKPTLAIKIHHIIIPRLSVACAWRGVVPKNGGERTKQGTGVGILV